MVAALAAGAAAGLGMGYVLQRGQLCFHSMFASALARRALLLRGWLLGVAVASVGLSLLYLAPWSRGLNTGLAFAPVADIAGGLTIGAGMTVARSCVSGLFYKLGSGMAGTLAGLAGWAAGELAARSVRLPGPTVLAGGGAGTFAGVLGVPRLALSAVFLAVVAVALWRWRPAERPAGPWQWDARRLGVALGLVTIAGWVLARAGGASFGPSTVGASASVASGSPNWWLIAFLLAIVAGAAVAARTAGGWRLRGEAPVRYGQLAAGGFLLGAGGWIAGGCNLGHGLSGAAQLNVSSWVVIASMATGVALSARAARLMGARLPGRRPAPPPEPATLATPAGQTGKTGSPLRVQARPAPAGKGPAVLASAGARHGQQPVRHGRRRGDPRGLPGRAGRRGQVRPIVIHEVADCIGIDDGQPREPGRQHRRPQVQPMTQRARVPPFCLAAPFVTSPDGCVRIRPIWRLSGRRTRPHVPLERVICAPG